MVWLCGHPRLFHFSSPLHTICHQRCPTTVCKWFISAFVPPTMQWIYIYSCLCSHKLWKVCEYTNVSKLTALCHLNWFLPVGLRSFFIVLSCTQEFTSFFHSHYNKDVTWADRMEFVNGWYILIIVSDTLSITGSGLKIGIQTKVYNQSNSNSTYINSITTAWNDWPLFLCAVYDRLWCVQHPAGNSHYAGLGRCDPVPRFL